MLAASIHCVSSVRANGASVLDREARVEAIRHAACRVAQRLPSLQRVILYGSLVNREPMVCAEAVLLVEVTTSPHAEPRDRVSGMLRALSPLPCPVDLFVLTSEEVARFSAEGSPLLRTILNEGMNLVHTS
jgi:hypothetical protein